jgi:hypothetical protein
VEQPIVSKTRNAFSLVCGVSLNIQASPGRIWGLLIDAENYPRWNSTVTSIEGRIAEGQSLRIRAPGTDRTFTPKVSGFVPNSRMTWTGGFAPMFKGVRTFELTPRADGFTEFAMKERFSGLMLPLIAGQFPDFGPIFSSFADDLRKEAERAEH